jgi:DNA repair protein RecN (Recombination protein N)
MLTSLKISNYALIDHLAMQPSAGLSMITGETGAGKSIILHALEFILGAKITASSIRNGADALEVQALFDLTDVPAEVKADLPDVIDGDEFVVCRTFPREGRGKVLINGRLGTVALLEEIVRKLVNICSQHHHTRLLDARYHLELLDGYCNHGDLLDKAKECYRAWAEKRTELERLQRSQAAGVARREELEAIVADLERLPHLKAGRRSDLDQEIKRISNGERLLQSGQRALQGLADEEGVSARLKEVASAVQEIARLDPGAASILDAFEVAREALAESELAIDRYVASLDLDAESLEALREELSDIARLERKYKTDDAGLCEILSEARSELGALSADSNIRALEQEVKRLHQQALTVGMELRKVRKAAAAGLSKEVAVHLVELNMRDASLTVTFIETDPTLNGIDRVEFLISTNKGAPHKPLVEIASGGELSRVMLVLKKILRERSGVNVLIFDEVDTGISGGVARSVGRMLKDISSQSQVICITHLPQVASLSDRHFLVNKEVSDRAITIVKQLSEEEKVDEIARMLAGYTITDASRASARELIASK